MMTIIVRPGGVNGHHMLLTRILQRGGTHRQLLGSRVTGKVPLADSTLR